jgi:Tfp pilus assembly major pilin PilA
MVNKKSAGFSLIEFIIAVGISAAITLIAFRGFAVQKSTNQFMTTIDELKEKITAVRTEAFSTVNINTAVHPGTDQTHVILGSLLTFTNGSPDIQVQKIIASNPSKPENTIITGLDVDRTISMPYNVKYSGPTTKVAMIRTAFDGSYVIAIGAWASPSYANISTPTAGASLSFVDEQGRQATIDFDPSTNGISRTFP